MSTAGHPPWCLYEDDAGSPHGDCHEGRPLRFQPIDDPLMEIVVDLVQFDPPGWPRRLVDPPVVRPQMRSKDGEDAAAGAWLSPLDARWLAGALCGLADRLDGETAAAGNIRR